MKERRPLYLTHRECAALMRAFGANMGAGYAEMRKVIGHRAVMRLQDRILFLHHGATCSADDALHPEIATCESAMKPEPVKPPPEEDSRG